MARGRLISKSLSTSQRFASLSEEAKALAEFCQALFPLLVAHADDFGRLPGDEFTVKHLVFPTSPRTLTEFGRALMALHRVGLVIWYEVDGRKYLQIVGFDRHQPGLHKRTRSEHPEPPGISGNVREIPSEQNRTEEKGTEEKDTAVAVSASDGFVEFWSAFPRKSNKPDALKAWRRLKPDAALRAAILEDVRRRIRSEPWRKDGGKFIPYPASYLRGRRWEDQEVSWSASTESASGPCPICGNPERCKTTQACNERYLAKQRAQTSRPASVATA